MVGPDALAVGHRSLPGLLEAQARDRPEAAAVSFAGAQMTYRELQAESERAARRLFAAGVRSGDRVAILLRQASKEYISLAFGAFRLGAICLAINSRNKESELRYVIEHAEPVVLLFGGEFADLVEAAVHGSGPRLVRVGEDAEFEAAGEEVAAERLAEVAAAVSPRMPALLLYTSGTTANPKGCLLSHGALLAEGRNCVDRLGLEDGDRIWTPMTMFHVGGWQVLMTTLTAGGAFSHPGFFEAEVALAQLERERCTVAFPAFELIWLAVLDHPRFADADLGSLRTVLNVGVRERLRQMQERVPWATQVSCFGMTESCGSMCIGETTDSFEQRTTTSGRPMPGMELRVVDPEGGGLRELGEPGELQFRGPTAFDGYFRDPEATAAAVIDGGWVRTGDLACILGDGTLQFRGRLKDMLKVGGENAAAPEIEGFLLRHPDVAVATVVGVTDDRYGEVPAAFVQKEPGSELAEEELIRFCVGQIASFKIPRYVRFVDQFPTTASEKIKKFALREELEAELRRRGITEAPRPA